MNRLQDCFDDNDADDRFGAGQLFQGMRYDPEQAKLFVFAPRTFHPKVQAWSDADPVAYVDGLNAYTAPVDDPVNPVDPLGT